jgi:ribosomal protein S18 acetylase RimI-like enzyme
VTHRHISIPPFDLDVAVDVRDLSGPDVTVRALEPADRPALDRLVRSVELFSPAEMDVAMEVLDAYFARPGHDYYGLGAFGPGDLLLGYACYGPTPCTEGTWDLYWIAVAGAARGRGVGSVLMEVVEHALADRQARMLLIETASRADYAPTRAFYQRRGYAEAARVADFYAPGDDRVIFVRTRHTA